MISHFDLSDFTGLDQQLLSDYLLELIEASLGVALENRDPFEDFNDYTDPC